MIQLYLLSVLCNGLSGYILYAGDETRTDTSGKGLQFSIDNPTFHLVLGILCAVTGFLKLLSPSLDGILILGDMVPAASGLIAGILMIFGIYRKGVSSASEGQLDRLGANLLRYRKSVGLGLIGTALIHFLIPQALFL
ncbi:MAG: hypothetical protein FWC03_04600 [Treponema sp.]|nr:hypothetical protein [Treponema sp.]